MAGCREKQDVLKVTYSLESYLVKVKAAICVCVCVCSCIYLCVCLPNTIMQPFAAAAECSKSIKEPTEVASVDHSGSVPEPGLCFKKKELFLTLVNVKVNSQSTGPLYAARTRKRKMEPVPF